MIAYIVSSSSALDTWPRTSLFASSVLSASKSSLRFFSKRFSLRSRWNNKQSDLSNSLIIIKIIICSPSAQPSPLAPFSSAQRSPSPSFSSSSGWFWWSRRGWRGLRRRSPLSPAVLSGNTVNENILSLSVKIIKLNRARLITARTHLQHCLHVQWQNRFLADSQQCECNLEDHLHAFAKEDVHDAAADQIEVERGGVEGQEPARCVHRRLKALQAKNGEETRWC